MLRYKIDIIKELRSLGYTTTKIRREKLFSESSMTDFRNGRMRLNTGTIETLCRVLKIQPGDLLEYVPDEPEEQPASAESIPAGAEDIF